MYSENYKKTLRKKQERQDFQKQCLGNVYKKYVIHIKPQKKSLGRKPNESNFNRNTSTTNLLHYSRYIKYCKSLKRDLYKEYLQGLSEYSLSVTFHTGTNQRLPQCISQK